MNPVTLDAIKLFLDLLARTDIEAEQKRLTSMVDKLIFIVEKDIDQAYAKYSSILK